jgi:hypothetical protein
MVTYPALAEENEKWKSVPNFFPKCVLSLSLVQLLSFVDE